MTLGIKNHLKNQPIEQSCNARHTAFEAIEKGSIPWSWAVGGFHFQKVLENILAKNTYSSFLFALSTVTIQVLTPEDWLWLKHCLIWSLLIGLVIAGHAEDSSLARVRQVHLTLPCMNRPLNFSLYGLLSCNLGPASSITLLQNPAWIACPLRSPQVFSASPPLSGALSSPSVFIPPWGYSPHSQVNGAFSTLKSPEHRLAGCPPCEWHCAKCQRPWEESCPMDSGTSQSLGIKR